MNLNFEVSLEDIGIGLELSGDSESERQEVMDFLVHVDESVADHGFSRELIYRLAENFTHDSEGYAYKNVALKGEQSGVTALYKSLSSVAEDLSHVDEEHLIVLMADAIFRKREREAKARQRAAAKKEDPPCTHCGCRRVYHTGDSGCLNHSDCGEWRQGKPLSPNTVCVCGHTKNWHMHGRGSSCQVAPDTSSATEYCPCPEFREKQSWKLTGRIDEVHSEEKQ